MVPLAAFSSYAPGTTPLSVNHQGPFVATTFSFNLPEGESLGTAVNAIQRTMAALHVPISVHGDFAGNARAFQRSLANEAGADPGGASITVYIVLGVLYESLVHPLTILSTLPSAGVGAVLALLIFGAEFSLIALIGVILLIGIVKKNAIMMIDFAITAQRNDGLDSREAIYRACMLRFRPIMMTTMSAILAALPLALITGDGAELRQPLGISIVGGLLVSQILTLYTTPVVYLYLDRFRIWAGAIVAAEVFRGFRRAWRSMIERRNAGEGALPLLCGAASAALLTGCELGPELYASFGPGADGIQGNRRLDARHAEAGGGLGELVVGL